MNYKIEQNCDKNNFIIQNKYRIDNRYIDTIKEVIGDKLTTSINSKKSFIKKDVINDSFDDIDRILDNTYAINVNKKVKLDAELDMYEHKYKYNVNDSYIRSKFIDNLNLSQNYNFDKYADFKDRNKFNESIYDEFKFDNPKEFKFRTDISSTLHNNHPNKVN